MRVAVVSDIHSNLHALEAVLAAIDAEAPDELWCLGDLVGYGPRPNECCALDRGASRRLPRREPRPRDPRHDRPRRVPRRRRARGPAEPRRAHAGVARVPRPPRAAAGTRTASRSTTAARATRSGSTCSPTRPRSRRSRSPARRSCSSGTATSRSASRRTAAKRTAASRRPARPSTLGDAPTLLNPGSVGQPRDGDPRAAYLLLDLDARRAEFRRVAYDVARTQSEMARGRAAGPARGPARARPVGAYTLTGSSGGGRIAIAAAAATSGAATVGSTTAAADGGLEELDAVAGERELDFLPRLPDPPLDRGERDLERVRDLGVREPDDVAQEERHLEIDA